jgi:hypothetical protein
MFESFSQTVTSEMLVVVSPNYFEFLPHYASSHFKTVVATVAAMKIKKKIQLFYINLRFSTTTKFHMQPALNTEYGERYMKLNAYVLRTSLLPSLRTAVHVKRK